MSSLVNIQSLITFLKKQIKVDMNTEINKIKNEYQNKIDELNSQINELSKSNGEIHILYKTGIQSSGTACYNYYTHTITPSNLDESYTDYKNFYFIFSRAYGVNVSWEGFDSITNLTIIGSVSKGSTNLGDGLGLTNIGYIYKVNDINQNISFRMRGMATIFIIGI